MVCLRTIELKQKGSFKRFWNKRTALENSTNALDKSMNVTTIWSLQQRGETTWKHKGRAWTISFCRAFIVSRGVGLPESGWVVASDGDCRNRFDCLLLMQQSENWQTHTVDHFTGMSRHISSGNRLNHTILSGTKPDRRRIVSNGAWEFVCVFGT